MHILYILNSTLTILFLSYLIGSIPFGFLIGKFNGLDIREHGSHNIGATNVRRVLGRDWSIFCFICDFLKGYLPVIYIGHHFGAQWAIGWEFGGIVAALGAVLGHVFPVWLRFKGGKGVATSLGVVLGLAFWPFIFGLIAWVIAFYSCKRIVAIASMAAVIVMAITSSVMWLSGNSKLHWATCILLILLAVLVVIRHKDNIKRIINGNENSFVKVKGKSNP